MFKLHCLLFLLMLEIIIFKDAVRYILLHERQVFLCITFMNLILKLLVSILHPVFISFEFNTNELKSHKKDNQVSKFYI